MKIYILTHDGQCKATGIYSVTEDGKIYLIVEKGSKIRQSFAEHIRGGRKAKSYRNNPEYVNEEGIVLQDCFFDSPSTAAQFVTGRSCNGYESWKVEPKKYLGQYLKEQGLR